MENLKHKGENLTDHLGDYVETQMKLFALRATRKSSEYISSGLAILFALTFLVFVFFFIGIGLGFWLGNLLDNMLSGFVIVAAFYSLLIILVLALRKNVILNIVRNLMIRKTYE